MTIPIGSNLVGTGHPVYVIAEIGLNHNGSVELAKQMIDVAAEAGAQAVKFQKRTPEISTPEHMKSVMRETPWGTMTYLEYRYRVEFDREQYIEVGDHATLRGLDWFASPWDEPARLIQMEKGIFKSNDSPSRPDYQYSFPTPVPDKHAAALPFVPNRRAQEPSSPCAT